MSRVQLALRVPDLDSAVEFYSKFFDAPVAKRRLGYANFAIADPPLKLVLLEGEPGEAAGLATEHQQGTTCCYALQDKTWTRGPGREHWEIYTVLADDRPDLEGVAELSLAAAAGDGGCCTAEDVG